MTLRRRAVEKKDGLDFTCFIIWCIQGLSRNRQEESYRTEYGNVNFVFLQFPGISDDHSNGKRCVGNDAQILRAYFSKIVCHFHCVDSGI